MQYNISYRKKDNSWQYIISYKDNNGRWKQKSKQGFKATDKKKVPQEVKDAAVEAVEQLKETIKNNINTEYDKITFKEFIDMYLKHLKLYREQNTILLYESALNYFTTLYDKKLTEVTPLDIQMCVDKMTQNDLKYSTIDTYLARIKVIFRAAVDPYKIIPQSPVNNINIKISKKPSTKKALTRAEFEKLISNTRNPKYKIMFILAGACGMRVGEILGLTWDRIDFKKGTIKIDRQWKNIGPRKTGFGELKSKNSYRTIPMSKTTIKYLLDFKNSHPINIDNRVIAYKEIQGLSQMLKNYFKKVGFDLTIHELRHTYATLLIADGTDWLTAAKLLGHDVEQTMHTYSHVTKDMMHKAQNIINNIF
ncbi:MAG: tyrosine-type recombinase/integrase [Clostridium sp.]|jgi:integrase|uniref:tyrosine-type recombinase/integrase n=1 Tax=Clostridium sp. TaxID=1506 RepID=UPI0025C1E301|nr:tyrosine-type recombinase/integrase [Clostridium sp.]MCH3962649.1 tyrosine-type recombinase/integrase [Clostridium sp.]MCI2201035.1 tyrosine-type recombinase/integrase [Clostridium sp.]